MSEHATPYRLACPECNGRYVQRVGTGSVRGEGRAHREGETLRIKPHMHDYSMDVYEAWQAKVDEMDTIERRKQENQGLGDFA